MRTASELLAQDFGTMSDLIRAHAAERPRAIALLHDSERLDYAQLNQLMDRVAAGLQHESLQAGDIIAICAFWMRAAEMWPASKSNRQLPPPWQIALAVIVIVLIGIYGGH